MKAIRVIWLAGAVTVEQRYHAAKALFESGLADWEAARQAVDRTPGILFMSDDPGKIDEVVRRLREAELQPQVTEREALLESRPSDTKHSAVSLVETLPEQLENALRESLAQGEVVEVSLHYGRQALAVTGKRVMLIRTGIFAASRPSWGGTRVKSFPFSQITSVDLRTGWVGGHVRITAPGPVENQEDWILRLEENAFVFQEERLKPLVKSAVEIIKARVKTAQESKRSEEPNLSSRHS